MPTNVRCRDTNKIPLKLYLFHQRYPFVSSYRPLDTLTALAAWLSPDLFHWTVWFKGYGFFTEVRDLSFQQKSYVPELYQIQDLLKPWNNSSPLLLSAGMQYRQNTSGYTIYKFCLARQKYDVWITVACSKLSDNRGRAKKKNNDEFSPLCHLFSSLSRFFVRTDYLRACNRLKSLPCQSR